LFRIEPTFLEVFLSRHSLRGGGIQNLLQAHQASAHQTRRLVRSLFKLIDRNIVRLAEMPHGENSAYYDESDHC
jgi:hypothetical protein